MKKKVLIADDESRMRILISDFLTNEGYQIIEAVDGEDAIDKFSKDGDIDLVILDVMMPRYNGWEVCEEIRRISAVPVIMLTAKNTENDELQGFKKGADEYIKKPFSPSILVARVNALMKRIYDDSETIINKGLLEIDVEKHKVKCQGASLDLSSTEYKLLMYMIESEEAVLSRDQLLDNVWGYGYEGTDRTVDTHINRLRDKLDGAGKYIKTVRGYGYKFEVIK
jgi:DNA-binding response OmpR family regulator